MAPTQAPESVIAPHSVGTVHSLGISARPERTADEWRTNLTDLGRPQSFVPSLSPIPIAPSSRVRSVSMEVCNPFFRCLHCRLKHTLSRQNPPHQPCGDVSPTQARFTVCIICWPHRTNSFVCDVMCPESRGTFAPVHHSGFLVSHSPANLTT